MDIIKEENIGIGGKNMNKIGWCDRTFNPAIGCNNNCEYCYARGIAKRFKKSMAIKETVYRAEKLDLITPSQLLIEGDKIIDSLDKFQPMFLHSQFEKRFPKKPQRIFVGSMSEIYYWNNRWMTNVLDKIELYPQHTFIFLTKFPEIYSMFMFPDNCWLGITITNSKDAYSEFRIAPENKDHIFFVCIEPMLDYIPIDCIDYADWVIIGAETGNRKGKIIPKNYWVEAIVSYCRDNCIPLYLKDSLKKIYPVEIKEFPEVK